MNTNHRGTPVGANHRPTPRIAQAVADLANQTILSHEGTLRTLVPHITPMSTEGAQDFLNLYRSGRDYRWHPPLTVNPMRSSASAMAPERAEIIGRAIDLRRQSRRG